MPNDDKQYFQCNRCSHIETSEINMDDLYHSKCGGHYRRYDVTKELRARVGREWLYGSDGEDHIR